MGKLFNEDGREAQLLLVNRIGELLAVAVTDIKAVMHLPAFDIELRLTELASGLRLAGVVEYLEDPTPGIPGMAQVAAGTDVPLATNMCVIAMEHLPPAIALVNMPITLIICRGG